MIFDLSVGFPIFKHRNPPCRMDVSIKTFIKMEDFPIATSRGCHLELRVAPSAVALAQRPRGPGPRGPGAQGPRNRSATGQGHNLTGKKSVIYWWMVWNMNFMTFHILGMSSSQLTFIVFRGVETSTTNQKKCDIDLGDQWFPWWLIEWFFKPHGYPVVSCGFPFEMIYIHGGFSTSNC